MNDVSALPSGSDGVGRVRNTKPAPSAASVLSLGEAQRVGLDPLGDEPLEPRLEDGYLSRAERANSIGIALADSHLMAD